MPLSSNPRSLLDSRLKKAQRLAKKLGRPPTYVELSERWGVPLSAAIDVVGEIRWRGIDLTLTPRARINPAKHHDRKIELAKMTKTLGRPPDRQELAKHWGVSVTRVIQVLSRIDS
jgi:DNA-directed RNA polymerase sigma subunit (sigma70/sigma32)